MSEPKKGDLTEREQHIANAAWKCLKEFPQVDYEKLSEAAGFQNARSATASWVPLRKKLGLDGPGTPHRKSTPNKKRAKGKEEQESPTKKAKKGHLKRMTSLDKQLLAATENVKGEDEEMQEPKEES